MGEPNWFMAYSHALQWMGEVAQRRKWELRREALEIKASLLVHAFWHETDVDLMMASIKPCWEPAPRTLYHQRKNGLLLTSSPILTHGTKWYGQPQG